MSKSVVSTITLLFVVISCVLPVCAAEPGIQQKNKNETGKSLLVHCAAGMQKVISRLGRDYEGQQGIKIEMNFDGSNRLLGQLKLTRRGDLYIAGDAEYIELAAKDGMIKNVKTVCYYVPVLLVKKDNPLQVKTLVDLLKPGIKIGQGDEKGPAIGKQTPRVLALNNIDRIAWSKNVVLNTTTVNELGAAIKLGTIDAAVVWSSTAADYANASTMIPLDPDRNIVSDVQGAVLSFSKEPELARDFLDFLSSTNVVSAFMEYGYVLQKPGKGVK